MHFVVNAASAGGRCWNGRVKGQGARHNGHDQP
jgi:hypothetical protein